MEDNNNGKIKYDRVIVLCPAEIDKDGKFSEYDDRGMYLGGQTRIDAAVMLYKANRTENFIVVGGLDKDCKDIGISKKTRDMERYLKEKCSKANIERINSLPCTKHNLIAVLQHLNQRGLDLINKDIGILTNYYHLPRIWRFLVEDSRENEIENRFIPIAAESIVCQPEIYIKNDEYLLRLNSEVKGMRDLELDEYEDCLIQKPPKFELTNEVLKKDFGLLLSKKEINHCPCGSGKKYKKCHGK